MVACASALSWSGGKDSARARQYINDQLQVMVNEIDAQGLASSTAIIISAKHGPSPQDPDQLTRIDDTPIIKRRQRGVGCEPSGRGTAGRVRHR